VIDGNSIGLRISITARTVRRWESDAPPWPHPDHQAAVEALFQRPITELGFTPPWVGTESGTSKPEGSPSLPGVAASSVGSLTVFPQRYPVASLPSSVVTDYISITSAHRHMYWTVPPAHLHDVVAAHVQLGRRLVPSVPEAARRSLAAAVSESSLLADRIEFFDLQNPAKGQASLVIALQAAQDAQDPLPGSAVLAHMAFIPAFSSDKKHAEEARDKIRAARAFARRGPASPEMLAWLDAVEAEVETRFGNTRKGPPAHPPRRTHLRHRRSAPMSRNAAMQGRASGYGSSSPNHSGCPASARFIRSTSRLKPGRKYWKVSR
jgi:hypothetical protein